MVFGWLDQLDQEKLSPELLLLKGLILDDNLARHADARVCYDQAEQIFKQQNDHEGLVKVKIRLAASFRTVGDGRKSLEMIQQAFKIMDSVHIQSLHVHALAIRGRGLVYSVIGRTADAMADLIQSLDLFEKLNDVYNVGYSHYDMGICLVKQGRISEAEYHHQKAIQIWESLNNNTRLAGSFNSLAEMLYLLGHYDEALKKLEHCLKIAAKIDSIRLKAFALAGVGDVHMMGREEYAQAINLYNESTELATKAGIQFLEIYNALKISECLFEQGNLETSERMIRRTRDKADRIGLETEVGQAFSIQAKIHMKQQKPSCIGLFEKAITFLMGSNELEEHKTRLYLAYALAFTFRDSRLIAASAHIQCVLSFVLNRSELTANLKQAMLKTRSLLTHFLHNWTGPRADNIEFLLSFSGLTDQDESYTQISAFGPLGVVINGVHRDLNITGYISECLMFLILEGRGRKSFSSEQIHKALWPDAKKAKAKAKQATQRLRDEFRGTDCFKQENYRYQLVNYWCDVIAFETLFDRASRLSPADALPAQEELIALYRGEFLEGLKLSPWGEAYRADLREKYLKTVELVKGAKR